MNVIWPESGKYIVAVSGGLDSMCLLDMLAARSGYELVVAHVDHGIREDSAHDTQLVREISQKSGFNIVITKFNYTEKTSEEELRQARYHFLYKEMNKHRAAAILTAHHADDVLETSIMNIRRGTDRYGAAGGMGRAGIVRPLINMRKKELVSYAEDHSLQWREDGTNADTKYTRNFVRHEVVPHINTSQYQEHLDSLQELNEKIDSKLKHLVSVLGGKVTLSRNVVSGLGLRELEVFVAYGIRQIDPKLELSQPQIARLCREILLDTTKSTFSYGSSTGIIIEIL